MSRVTVVWVAALALLMSGGSALALVARRPLASAEAAPPQPESDAFERPHRIRATDSLVNAAIRAHPFRPDRSPASQAYDPAMVRGPEEPAPTPPPRPALRLAGMVLGSAPAALIDGIPNREGTVALRIGDTAGGVRVRRIDRSSVTLDGLDTTWVLVPAGTWTP